MSQLNRYERITHTRFFLRNSLTSHERLVVAALTLGFSQSEIARAWAVSQAAVSKTCRRILRKAEKYWR
jgi:DNA-binding NarL/FixJ family response regulator